MIKENSIKIIGSSKIKQGDNMKIRKLVLVLLSITLAFYLTNIESVSVQMSYAEQSEEKSISGDELQMYVAEQASEYIGGFLGLSGTMYGVGIEADKPFYLGGGIPVYGYEEGEWIDNEMIAYPIIQDDHVVLTLKLSNVEGKFYVTATSELVDEMNSIFQSDTDVFILYRNEEPFIVMDEGNFCINYVDAEPLLDTSVLSKVLSHEVSSVDEESLIESGYISNPIGMISVQNNATAPGFSIYTDNYKVLQMENCLSDQCGPDGKQRGLCWAATAATIVKYKTGSKYALTAWNIAAMMGIGYDEGGKFIVR